MRKRSSTGVRLWRAVFPGKRRRGDEEGVVVGGEGVVDGEEGMPGRGGTGRWGETERANRLKLRLPKPKTRIVKIMTHAVYSFRPLQCIILFHRT